MIIVFEGVNKVGKTTLMEKISNKLSIPCFRNMKNPDMKEISGFCHYNDFNEDIVIFNLLRTIGGSILLDRSISSDCIYKRMINVYFPQEILEWWKIKLLELKVIYIWVDSPWDEINNRKNHSEIKFEKYEYLTKEYRNLYDYLSSCGVRTIHFNNTGDINKNVDELMIKINKLSQEINE